jgi:hypothetical protein
MRHDVVMTAVPDRVVIRIRHAVMTFAVLAVGVLTLGPSGPLPLLAGSAPGADPGLLATALAAVAALLVAVGAAGGRRASVMPPAPQVVTRPDVARRERAVPPRQVDPDAAGHVRSRAPGRRRSARPR